MRNSLVLLVRWQLVLVVAARRRSRERDARGDVPGWVLVTIMTVGLMAVISTLASDQLSSMLQSALNSVR